MGAMHCDRIGCDNVMCRHIILTNFVKYICDTCLDELKEYKQTWELPLSIGEVEEKIRSFMKSDVGSHVVKLLLTEEEVDQEFNRLIEKSNNDW